MKQIDAAAERTRRAKPAKARSKPPSLTRREAELAINDLIRRCLTQGDPVAWMRRYLMFIGRMSHYSIFNANLVYLQRPGALAVGTERYWRERGRTVRPGAMPIVIFAPLSPYALVYELEDTEERSPSLFSYTPEPPRGSQAPDKAWAKFRDRAEAYGNRGNKKGIFRIIEDALGSSLFGDVHERRDSQDRFVIRINRNNGPQAKWLTLAHELSHVFCGHAGLHPASPIPHRPELNGMRQQEREVIEEFEAEAVVWLLATRVGIDASSPDYLAERATRLKPEMLDIAAVLAAANRIEPLHGARAEVNAASWSDHDLFGDDL